MAVETGLGCPVASAFSVVHVDGEVKVQEVALHDVRGSRLGKHGLVRYKDGDESRRRRRTVGAIGCK